MNVLITGGTGFIGRHLVEALTQDGHTVMVLTRQDKRSENRYLSYLTWDGEQIPVGTGIADLVINLAGSSIAGGRWTESNKEEIMQSRMKATRACVQYINGSPRPPKLFLSASAVGYYGIGHKGEIDEKAKPGKDFAAEVCQAWEEEAAKAHIPTVLMRFGIVLGKDGGALEQMLPIYQKWLGATFASGKQGFPWIHIQDIVEIILFLIKRGEITGPVNCVAPQVTDQATFSHTLARALGKKAFLTVPRFALKLIFGEAALLFYGGQKAIPRVLQREGYRYQFSKLRHALKDLLSKAK